jgi:hypothetical protein
MAATSTTFSQLLVKVKTVQLVKSLQLSSQLLVKVKKHHAGLMQSMQQAQEQL